MWPWFWNYLIEPGGFISEFTTGYFLRIRSHSQGLVIQARVRWAWGQ